MTKEALNRLTEVVTRMMTQIQNQRRSFQPRLLVPSIAQNSEICLNLRNPSSNSTTVHQAPIQNTLAVNSNSNRIFPDPQQALYALLNNSNAINSQGNSSYLGIPEDDENLFLLADYHVYKKPIAGTEILRKKKNEKVVDTSSDLVETEEIVNPNVDIVKEQEEPKEDRYEEKDSKKIKEKWNYDSLKTIIVGTEKKVNQGLWSVDRLNFRVSNYQPIANLFDYYYDYENWTIKKYKIEDLKEIQRRQLYSLLDENRNLCAKSLKELGRSNLV
ncbi:33773_t:CDS:2 [Gigaspora margarita]|uniref:33773_t:CDS:1 n=1 Tax=Gigaspora margarita TaxID=4874 RepID=A0ABM8W2H3_GIGMA|nr:33773_t:CDS:2 [Gigaspora margarita]